MLMESTVISVPPIRQQRATELTAEATDAWKTLYRVSAVAALIVAVFTPLQIILFLGWPPPGSVAGYFALFQSNRLLGLLDLDLLMIIDELLMIPLLLALYIALRRSNPSLILIATALGLISVALYCVSREATFTMSALSDQYAVATTEAQKTMLLTIGQMMLATYNGTVFDLYYILGAVGGLITAIVMLRSHIFSRFTGYAGLVMSGLMLVPPTIGPVGLMLSLFSLVPMMIWLILLARRFLQLAQS
jgi:hypothetical protein